MRRRLNERQVAVIPLLLGVLFGVTTIIWLMLSSVLPGAWIFPFVTRSFPSILSALPLVAQEFESRLS